MNIITVNHTSIAGTEALNVVMADEAIAEVERLKAVLSNAYFGIRELKSQFEFCDCSDDPQDDICMHCILSNIMHDIETQKALEEK